MPTKSQPCNAICAALALSCGGLGLSAGSLSAQDTLSGFYVNTGAGLNLSSDLNAAAVSISLRPGVRGDASLGRAWGLAGNFSAGAEIQTGILYNTLDKARSQGQSVSVGGSLMDVPLLAHAVLHWQFQPRWTAYAGAGVGCAFSSLHINSTGGNYGLNGTDVDFAWQAMTGIRYRFGASEVGLGYEYFSFRRSGVEMVGNNTILVSYTFRF
jgi:OmpA-OmpF porin, OOP family